MGSYLLSQLTAEYGNDIGLYRDDGLAAFDKTPREIEIIKKSICKVFSNNNLKVTIEANKKCVDYLDITLDLRSSSHKPYMKPGNTPLYINYNSNHPPPILRMQHTMQTLLTRGRQTYPQISYPSSRLRLHIRKSCERAVLTTSLITIPSHQSLNVIEAET